MVDLGARINIHNINGYSPIYYIHAKIVLCNDAERNKELLEFLLSKMKSDNMQEKNWQERVQESINTSLNYNK